MKGGTGYNIHYAYVGRTVSISVHHGSFIKCFYGKLLEVRSDHLVIMDIFFGGPLYLHRSHQASIIG